MKKYLIFDILHLTFRRKENGFTRRFGGFTLLELLVVIGIIAMLVSIAAVSYSVVQKRARDARRRQDIKTIRQAMETAYGASSTFLYPTCSTGVAISSSNCAISTYVESIPTDPASSATVFYSFTASSTTAYTVCATLEQPVGGTFCLSNLQ